MSLAAGRLRHRVTIQRQRNNQDLDDGTMTTFWKDVATNVAAEIAPLSVKDFIAAGGKRSEISVRITIRYRAGLLPSMRLVGLSAPYIGQVFNPVGWLPDPDSGVEYVTAPCSLGVNDGE